MKKIAAINDALRQSLPFIPAPHKLILSASVASLSIATLHRIFNAIKATQSFSQDDDPYGEHDFGNIVIDGTRYFWKFDYYDTQFEFFKDNGNRVLTIMSADEY